MVVPSTKDDASSLTGPATDPVFKTVGIILALMSGLFIGSSFIFKKKGLLQAQSSSSGVAGEGHKYLSSGLWWIGMTLMIIGEVCNFVAYAFTQAILVTPLGALSVVISAVLSSIFLNERLNMQGKIGCALCVIGAINILLHAPDQQSANTIDEFQKLFFAPGFLVYAGLAIVSTLIVIWKVAPKYGSKNMLVYIGICSIIGSLSVVATQGLGSAIVSSIMGKNQFTHWFLYVLAAFVVTTLLTEINYLNKALNLFNTAMVTPVYYVTFTSLTMISSAILFQGFTAPPQNIVAVVLGFLVICLGIVELQTSKSASVDRPSTIYGDDNRSSYTSDLEPGAPEMRGGSFSSVRRYSMAGRVHPNPNMHRKTVSLTNWGRESTASNTLSPISESIPATISVPNKSGVSRGNVDTTPTELSIAMGESPYDKDSVELSSTMLAPSRISTVRFPGSTSESQHRSLAPSVSITETSPPTSPRLALPPPLSPLQHPINYLKSHLSQNTPTSTEFTNSETYSGINLDRNDSTASRRLQSKMSIIDKFKLGLNNEGDDFQGLVSHGGQEVGSSGGGTAGKGMAPIRTDVEGESEGKDDELSSGNISPISPIGRELKSD